MLLEDTGQYTGVYYAMNTLKTDSLMKSWNKSFWNDTSLENTSDYKFKITTAYRYFINTELIMNKCDVLSSKMEFFFLAKLIRR